MYRKVPVFGTTRASTAATCTPPWPSDAMARAAMKSPTAPYTARSSDDVVAPGIRTVLRNHSYVMVTGSPSGSEAVAVMTSTSFGPGDVSLRVIVTTGGALAMTTEAVALVVSP